MKDGRDLFGCPRRLFGGCGLLSRGDNENLRVKEAGYG